MLIEKDTEFNFKQLCQLMIDNELSQWAEVLPQQLDKQFSNPHGDLKKWWQNYKKLPQVTNCNYQLDSTIRIDADFSSELIPELSSEDLDEILMGFSPWRKGPYKINQSFIDTEWRSDWKWDRLKEHISPLSNRVVLDVGCGNGYHCWRMHEAGAKLVIGIDPSWMFLMQFHVIKHFVGAKPVFLLPLGIEHLPAQINRFDTIFSMGVFYHRRAPLDHIYQLKEALRPGGELVLETLIVDGDKGYCLVPDDRYAKMRNVWFLPSIDTLKQWMQRCGLVNIKVVDINQTTIEEQRATKWMQNESLQSFLNPDNPNQTIEGHPAPKRATLIASKP